MYLESLHISFGNLLLLFFFSLSLQLLLLNRSENWCKLIVSQMMKWRVICRLVWICTSSLIPFFCWQSYFSFPYFSWFQKYRLHTRRVQCTPTNQPVVLGSLWLSQEQGGESLKPSTSQSGSPQGPLHLTGSSRATSMTAADSMEDNDDENLESHSWKNRIHLSNA